MDKSQFPKAVHEKIHPRSGRAYHFRQRSLTYLRNYGLRRAFLAKVSEYQKNPCQPLFTRIEKLVNQIFLIADVPCQQVDHEHIRHFAFAVKRFHHDFLINSQNSAIGNGTRRPRAQPLSRHAAFTEKIAFSQYSNRRFLAIAGYDSKLDFALLDIEDRVGGVTLRENSLLLREVQSFPTVTDRREESMRIESSLFWQHYTSC